MEATTAAPWLGWPVYAAAVNAWARAEAACQRIADWLGERASASTTKPGPGVSELGMTVAEERVTMLAALVERIRAEYEPGMPANLLPDCRASKQTPTSGSTGMLQDDRSFPTTVGAVP